MRRFARRDRWRFLAATCLLSCGVSVGRAVPPEVDVADPAEFFHSRVEPILRNRCYECHSATSGEPKGGLRLDEPDALAKGGASGPALVPGRPDESLLVSALRYEALEMPPDEPLPPEEIAEVAAWIGHGAVDPRPHSAAAEAAAPASARVQDHWAWRRPQAAEPSSVDESKWSRTAVDRFIELKLREGGLVPSPDAEPRTLVRRLSVDLTGLPPTFAEVERFCSDGSDAPYDRLVDRLLASPHFGERWGRHWLDVARYSDTKGYLFLEDRAYRTAYKYRDWVIQSFNQDMPYDEFVLRQLAGEQLPADGSRGDGRAAEGFLTLGRRFLHNPHDIIDDRIDVACRGLMGLSVSCARCHDHKYDPIPSADYYSLYGVFASSQEVAPADAPPSLVDAPQPVEPVVFLRGNPQAPGPRVPRKFLSCLAGGDAAPFAHGSGRLELARAIVDRDNPLTARVWVNRVWAHLVGRGLVATPSDFGVRGSAPSHPQLLDWLAVRFVEHGWSTKWLIRTIVRSSVYRQSSAGRPDARVVDADNALLARRERRRLDLESLRDGVLAAAGALDCAEGGPSVEITTQPFSGRRAIYGYIERQNLPAFFRTFDFSNPNMHTPLRPETVSPHQALFMLNSPFIRQQAAALARRTEREAATELSDSPQTAPELRVRRRIERLYEDALVRRPTAEEIAEATEYLGLSNPPVDRPQSEVAVESESRWTELAQAVLMSNEFLFVD
jgi:hypothetical protein